jgi:hypothetical protein
MRLRKHRIRMRIDRVLAELDVPPSPDASPRRQLLAPLAPAPASDRSRPTLLAPVRELSGRLTAAGTISS